VAEVTLRQAATMVGISRQAVYRMAADGRLTVSLRPDYTRPGPDGTKGAGHVKVVDTAELLRVFGRLTPPAPVTDPVGHGGAGFEPGITHGATGSPRPAPVVVAMTADDRRREYEVADREALRAELAAARAALAGAERQLAEASQREAKLLDIVAGHTRLLEHKASAETPPRPGFWRRVFGG
jgi:hypothetical protein